MLQIANLEEYKTEDIPKLVELIQPIFSKRKQLHKKYSKGADQSHLMYSDDNNNTVVPLEKFFTDLATGYNAGTPIYRVDVSKDKDKNAIIQKYLDKQSKDDTYAKTMQVLIDFISNYNDDTQENYDLMHDIFEMTACYEYIYENKQNEIVYSRLDPLQTVATWDYSIPANLTGFIRIWNEKDINNNSWTKVQLIDKEKTNTYSIPNSGNNTIISGAEAKLDSSIPHQWGDVPGFAVEVDYSIFETSEDIIKAYEQLIQNTRNTYQYNDTEAKLKIKGYVPKAEAVIKDANGDWIRNPERVAEDQAILESRTFYIQDQGDIDWIMKPTDSAGTTNVLKTYSDLSFQLSGIPNTSDLAFNSADLNASAIDRKFYVMNMFTCYVISLMKKGYLRRWELVFNRINLKKNSENGTYKFDFRDISIDIPKNLPSNDSERADYFMKLDGKLSTQTQLEALGFDYYAEKERLDREAEENMQANMERLMSQGEDNESDTEEMEQDGQDIEELSSEVSE